VRKLFNSISKFRQGLVKLVAGLFLLGIGDTSFGVTYTWTGNTSTAWATTTNWSPNSNPGSAAGDIVQIGVTSFAGNQPTLSVTPPMHLPQLLWVLQLMLH